MSLPKIFYFPVRGRAELIRITLFVSGHDWEEVNAGADLPKLKEDGKLAFNQVPLYQEGDFQLVQSNAITRYVARKGNLYGKDNHDAARIDQAIDGIGDYWEKLIPNLFPTKNEEGLAKFQKETFPTWFGYFERLLKKNHEGKGFLVGDSLSVADLSLYLTLESFWLDSGWGNRADHPTLSAYFDRLIAHPKIAEYAKNPKRFPGRKL